MRTARRDLAADRRQPDPARASDRCCSARRPPRRPPCSASPARRAPWPALPARARWRGAMPGPKARPPSACARSGAARPPRPSWDRRRPRRARWRTAAGTGRGRWRSRGPAAPSIVRSPRRAHRRRGGRATERSSMRCRQPRAADPSTRPARSEDLTRGACRTRAHRGAAPGGVAHELLHGANALRVQSREHPDGWGLGWYVDRVPQVVRSLTAAHGDDDFEEVSSFVTASTILAHIRKASIGRVSFENTHPFEWGPWLFAHNGTVPGWEERRAGMESEIDPALRNELRGETDSERCFLVFLTRLSRRCDPTAARFEDAAAAMGETVQIVVRTCGGEAATTFLATDGQTMLACRRARTLYVSAAEPQRDGRVAWFAVASEDPRLHEPVPPGRSPWHEVPAGTIVGVDAELRLRRAAL